MGRRRVATVIGSLAIAAVLCSIAGCQSAPAAGGDVESRATHAGLVLTGSVLVTEAVSVHATFRTPAMMERGGTVVDVPARSTCAQYAQGYAVPGGSRGFDPPMFSTSGVTSVSFAAAIHGGYRGPGTYENTDTPQLSGRAVEKEGNVELNGGFYDVFNTRPPATTSVTVSPDGGGSLRFDEWQEVGPVGGATISGTITWTCGVS